MVCSATTITLCRRGHVDKRHRQGRSAPVQKKSLETNLNVAVRSGRGLQLADVWNWCYDSLVATVTQLAHHRSAVIRACWGTCTRQITCVSGS